MIEGATSPGEDPHARLARIFERAAEPPAVLLGAGASMPQLPVARDLKQEILTRTADMARSRPADLDQLRERIDQPHFTLELLCSMLRYRCAPAYDAVAMWSALCSGVPPSRLTSTIASLRSAGMIGPIVTTNFDATCMSALERSEQRFRVITEWQVRDADEMPEQSDICALHGTTYRAADGEFAPPLSATVRGLARPFTPGMRHYLAGLFRPGRPVVVVGYSGQDHYDVNPLLRELHREDADRLREWMWICHRERDRDDVPAVVAARHVVGDATELLGALCAERGLPVAGGEDVETVDWRGNLRAVFRGFDLPADGVDDFFQDLRSNIAGAWAVLEHYRLFSGGYDTAVTLTFGGVKDENADADHLSFRFGGRRLPFGKLLHASAVYRTEDASSDGYPQSLGLLNDALTALETACEAEDESARAEERALVRVGIAIAEDYLGLIDRKLAMRTGGSAAEHLRAEAIAHFQRCRERAEDAGQLLAATRRGSEPELIEDLVQHRTWALIGQANMARTLDRAAAVEAYDAVVALQLAVMAEQRGSGEVAGYDEVVVFAPQLWLRASEWLKAILDCSGERDAPVSWDRIDDRWRAFADKSYRTCLNAYAEYNALSSQLNSRYPAYFETRILYFAARAQARNAFAEPERRAARSAAEQAFAELRALAEANPDVSPTWVGNAEERFARIALNW
ncbi:SIR2 family protein [Saccharopolyspora cebuensis]|uniref:SIR2 family protein n=1 Tax=Saccharopolyspora cebuensis TaxID=418759 RepID=A0ABV4CK67_9PSEU